MNEKYYCSVCDTYILRKSNHNKSKSHKRLLLSVVNTFLIKQAPVKLIDLVLNRHIIEYNKKFHSFQCYCEFQNENFYCRKNLGWISRPDTKCSEIIEREYNCSRKELVNMKIFITDLEYLSYEHYLKQPRQMIERKLCRLIDQNPNLIKTLNNMPMPYKRHLTIEKWGFKLIDPDGVESHYVPVNWRDLEPYDQTIFG